ncbi:MAG: TetR/AcrR family transcriptional regulator, partial [Thermodesulfobacteriota bacterium]
MRKNRSAQIRKPEILENYYQVLVKEGLEGASIGKIAKRMNIHPSLIIHYFQSKNNMTIELVDLIVEKYEAPQFLQFNGYQDPQDRFQALLDTIFSKDWSKTVDPSVFFAFYYLSFRNDKIRARFEAMFKRFRDYLVREFQVFKEAGIIKAE